MLAWTEIARQRRRCSERRSFTRAKTTMEKYRLSSYKAMYLLTVTTTPGTTTVPRGSRMVFRVAGMLYRLRLYTAAPLTYIVAARYLVRRNETLLRRAGRTDGYG